jgi:hypothetical protein
MAKYGSYGTKQDQILQPYGICCDDYGYIFVADNQNHRIHVLLPDGTFSKYLLTKSDGLVVIPLGCLKCPEIAMRNCPAWSNILTSLVS